MRLFAALELPEAWRDAAAGMRERLREQLGAGSTAAAALRFTAPERMHLTLRFFGEVDEERAIALDAALASAITSVAVRLELTSGGTFGSRSRPSVVWLGVGGDLDGLNSIAAQVDLAAASAGLEVERRPLRPHITLARLDRHADAPQGRAISEAVAALGAPPPSPSVAREVVLVRSHLGARARYEVLGRFPKPSI